MSGIMVRSWRLMKASLRVIREDKRILVFPLLSGASMLILAATFIGSMLFAGTNPILAIILLFVIYLMLYFVSIYFNTAVIGFASIKLEGGYPEIRDGIRTANRNLWSIFKWAVVAATVGAILRIISSRQGLVGKIIVSITGFAWSMATFFVVPVLVYEGASIRDALKRSIRLFKSTWGEAAVGSLSVSAVIFSLGFAGITIIIFGSLVGGHAGFLFSLSLAMIYWIILSCIGIAAQGVLTATLYRYASMGLSSSVIPASLFRP